MQFSFLAGLNNIYLIQNAQIKERFFSFYKSLEAHLRMCNHPQGSQERKTICSLGVGCHLKPNSLMINIGAVAPFVTKYKYKYEEICVQHKYYKAI